MSILHHPSLVTPAFSPAKHQVAYISELNKYHRGEIVLVGEKIAKLPMGVKESLYEKLTIEFADMWDEDEILTVKLREIHDTSNPLFYFYSVRVDTYTISDIENGIVHLGPEGMSAKIEHKRQITTEVPSLYIEHSPVTLEKKHAIRNAIAKIFRKK